ncbi:MAG TPA: hypothetical protein VKV29_01270 [Chthonomonas sp.]|nr:hypothetical protein [Chthonomonas sp.]
MAGRTMGGKAQRQKGWDYGNGAIPTTVGLHKTTKPQAPAIASAPVEIEARHRSWY